MSAWVFRKNGVWYIRVKTADGVRVTLANRS